MTTATDDLTGQTTETEINSDTTWDQGKNAPETRDLWDGLFDEVFAEPLFSLVELVSNTFGKVLNAKSFEADVKKGQFKTEGKSSTAEYKGTSYTVDTRGKKEEAIDAFIFAREHVMDIMVKHHDPDDPYDFNDISFAIQARNGEDKAYEDYNNTDKYHAALHLLAYKDAGITLSNAEELMEELGFNNEKSRGYKEFQRAQEAFQSALDSQEYEALIDNLQKYDANYYRNKIEALQSGAPVIREAGENSPRPVPSELLQPKEEPLAEVLKPDFNRQQPAGFSLTEDQLKALTEDLILEDPKPQPAPTKDYADFLHSALAGEQYNRLMGEIVDQDENDIAAISKAYTYLLNLDPRLGTTDEVNNEGNRQHYDAFKNKIDNSLEERGLLKKVQEGARQIIEASRPIEPEDLLTDDAIVSEGSSFDPSNMVPDDEITFGPTIDDTAFRDFPINEEDPHDFEIDIDENPVPDDQNMLELPGNNIADTNNPGADDAITALLSPAGLPQEPKKQEPTVAQRPATEIVDLNCGPIPSEEMDDEPLNMDPQSPFDFPALPEDQAVDRFVSTAPEKWGEEQETALIEEMLWTPNEASTPVKSEDDKTAASRHLRKITGPFALTKDIDVSILEAPPPAVENKTAAPSSDPSDDDFDPFAGALIEENDENDLPEIDPDDVELLDEDDIPFLDPDDLEELDDDVISLNDEDIEEEVSTNPSIEPPPLPKAEQVTAENLFDGIEEDNAGSEPLIAEATIDMGETGIRTTNKIYTSEEYAAKQKSEELTRYMYGETDPERPRNTKMGKQFDDVTPVTGMKIKPQEAEKPKRTVGNLFGLLPSLDND